MRQKRTGAMQKFVQDAGLSVFSGISRFLRFSYAEQMRGVGRGWGRWENAMMPGICRSGSGCLYKMLDYLPFLSPTGGVASPLICGNTA
jgi:hypothetical protein